MSVAARFWVQSVKKSAVSGGSVIREVILAPVLRTGTNVQWSKYTPAGEIRLTVTDEGAGQQFEDALAQDVAITFEFPGA